MLTPSIPVCLWHVNQFCMGHLQRRPSHRSISTSARHPLPHLAGHGGRLSSAPQLGFGERPHSIPQHASFMIRSAQVPGISLTRFMLGMAGAPVCCASQSLRAVSARTSPLLTPNWTIYFRTWLSRASSVQVLGCLYLVNVEHGGRSCVAPPNGNGGRPQLVSLSPHHFTGRKRPARS